MVTPAGMVLDGALDRIEPPRELTRARRVARGTRSPRAWSIIWSSTSSTTLSRGPTGRRRRRRPAANSWQRSAAPSATSQTSRSRTTGGWRTSRPVYDPQRGGLNRLFATATPLHDEVDDGSGFPPLKRPLSQPFLVRDIFTDFKRHDLGPNFHEQDFNGTVTTQFMTMPLWGVGSTAPYGHDGRSINLEEVILRHGGRPKRRGRPLRNCPRRSRTRCSASSRRWCCSRRTTRPRTSIPAVSASECCSMTPAILNRPHSSSR